jgi:hypothetical protein
MLIDAVYINRSFTEDNFRKLKMAKIAEYFKNSQEKNLSLMVYVNGLFAEDDLEN